MENPFYHLWLSIHGIIGLTYLSECHAEYATFILKYISSDS